MKKKVITFCVLAFLVFAPATSAVEKVLIIGLDGATWTTLEPWIEQGNMPYLKSLYDSGSHSSLMAPIPYVSPVSWPTFATGNNPGRHGIYGFQQCADTDEPRIPLGDSIQSERVWQTLSKNGRKSIIMNLQNTYPPDKINGIVISGVMAPQIAVEPKSLRPWLIEEGYIVEGAGWMNTEKPEFIKSLYNTTEKRVDVAVKLMEREPDWDFMTVLIVGTDRIQHYMWRDMEEGGQYENAMEDYYKFVDTQIQELVEAAGPDTNVFIISDHGFGRLKRRVHINWWLEQEGYLKIENNWDNSKARYMITISGVLKKTGISEIIRKFMVKSGGDAASVRPPTLTLDFENSKAYTCGYYTGQIYLNPNLTDEEYRRVQQEIMEKLRNFKDPKTGMNVVENVYTKDELYHGMAMDEAPDILMIYANEYWVVGSFSYPWLFEDTFRETGCHHQDGIMIASGPDIQTGAIVNDARLMDMAPTVLHMFGIDENMDGRPLIEILEQ
ncbi:MAG TPA: hypothetical protein ENN13_04585 [Candidatus Altiarchaeales archaeon]|nr:hypothetical protein [Candidatus Altiarchaeales archaeon]